jgi:dTDP-4-amino-4,6-dideoxygalactose transaminase
MVGELNFYRFYGKYLNEFKQAIEEFILSGQYIGGQFVEDFEKQVCSHLEADYAIGCKSGTHALQLALLAAGIGRGDEVITVANTYYATPYSIFSIGAKPVFCDVRSSDGLLDPNLIEECITDKTRAIMPVHLYGNCAPLDEIFDISKANQLVVIEDCAHAFGSSYKGRPIGKDSELACFSFYPTKSLGAFGDAGMVITKSKEHMKKLRKLRYFADDNRINFNPHAIHARLDPIQAILLSVMLTHFNEIKLYRQKLAKLYRKKLSGIVQSIPEAKDNDICPYVFPVFIKNRAKLIKHLKKNNIRLQVHYPTNLHFLPEFGGATIGSLPNTEQHNSRVISLPVHPSICEDEAKYICDKILNALYMG